MMGKIGTNGLPRPHRLYVQQSKFVGKDDNGFDLPCETEWVFWCGCRDQPSEQGRQNRTMKGANGESFLYSSIVFVDVDTLVIEAGTCIEVREQDDFVRLTGEVKRFSTDMLHARIWV